MKILEKRHIDFLADELDNLLQVDNKIIEAVDGAGARIALKYLNAALSDKVEDVYKQNVHEVLDLVIEGKTAEAVAGAIGVIEIVVLKSEIKETHAIIFKALVGVLKASLISFLDKKADI